MRSPIQRLVVSTASAGRRLPLVLVAAVCLIAAPASTAGAEAPGSKWQTAIDSTWGPGAPTERKLEIFDAFWTAIDQRSAVFPGVDVDWAGLRDRYRPEIAAGVSRGRFAAIMGQLTLALQDGHTFAFDLRVVQTTRDPAPGVPVFIVRGRAMNTNFGACVTALPNGSAMVYNVAPGHPLGLMPGDRILGYDGRPWRKLYRELLVDELPVRGNLPSNLSSSEHLLAQSAAVNWHLFTTIDILKRDTGTVEHFPTAALNLAPPLSSPVCTEGLPQPGVPQPTSTADGATWGVIAGTRIGYIRFLAVNVTASARFAQAVSELTRETTTDGLIVDLRFNGGGFFTLANPALSMLFAGPVPGIGSAERADPTDHLALQPTGEEDFGPPPDTASYDRPIAVLTGPNTFSAGEHVALRLSYHPRARTFGKPTNGAFGFTAPVDLQEPGWIAQYSPQNSYLVDRPNDYLDHKQFRADRPVWLRPNDVARGKDTVVGAALRWINRETP